MFGSPAGDARVALYLIGAGLIGPVFALPMAMQGRSRMDFILLAAGCVAAVAMGTWMLLRVRRHP